MARSNKFLSQVKGYSAGIDVSKKQNNATTELVKRLDENSENDNSNIESSETENSSQNLINETVPEEERTQENSSFNAEKTTISEEIKTDNYGEDSAPSETPELSVTSDVPEIKKQDFSDEQYIKTTISIDAVLFNTFKYIAKTNKTTITDYLIDLLSKDKQEKQLNPTTVDFTKRIENKKLKNPYQRHYIGLPESLMDFVRKEAFKTQTTVSGYITKIIEQECEEKKELYL